MVLAAPCQQVIETCEERERALITPRTAPCFFSISRQQQTDPPCLREPAHVLSPRAWWRHRGEDGVGVCLRKASREQSSEQQASHWDVMAHLRGKPTVMSARRCARARPAAGGEGPQALPRARRLGRSTDLRLPRCRPHHGQSPATNHRRGASTRTATHVRTVLAHSGRFLAEPEINPRLSEALEARAILRQRPEPGERAPVPCVLLRVDIRPHPRERDAAGEAERRVRARRPIGAQVACGG